MFARQRNRRGNVIVLSAFLMAIMIGTLAFALDLGLVYVARSQLQRSADAAALAAAWELMDTEAIFGTPNTSLDIDARNTAEQYAFSNYVLAANPALAEEDVTIGYMENPIDPNEQIQVENPPMLNAVRVRVRRSSDQNGEIPLFFARIMGHEKVATQAEATAALLVNIRGFRAPGGNENLGMLPFALDEDTWLDMLAGGGTDDWMWDSDTGLVVPGADGIREINLYPQGTGAPGNRGTVDIGSSNNSTNDIARQILHGASPEDLAYHGGKLEFDDNGELILNGDTGISAGVKDELEAIKGTPRIIPIFRSVTGPGNNAMYTIVGFVGVRITEVQLTANMNTKRVIIQPANVVTRGGIAGDDTTTSFFVFSPVWLVR